ncbi:GPW/gp25 family protein [Nocardioides sp.]|uniref:GPW/gp25 family protein n=1 Tax=Nocardioides sp. TaxID=35761 RepID=UPI002619ABF0|nr:GPW/gp25 family protein [Nocardioides sp.]MDI6911488.1 GPW/gp25 family protein [Nocardioides sp.]
MPKHLALPLRVSGSGALSALEQDSDREITQSVALLLDTRPGERRSVPGYGLSDPLGSGVSHDVIADAVTEWEDRAESVFVEQLAETLVDQQVSVYPPDPTPSDLEEEE